MIRVFEIYEIWMDEIGETLQENAVTRPKQDDKMNSYFVFVEIEVFFFILNLYLNQALLN